MNSTDALLVLRYKAELSVAQNEPCPDIGTGTNGLFGDVDCSASISSVDALKILRHAAFLSVMQNQPCTVIGVFPATGTY